MRLGTPHLVPQDPHNRQPNLNLRLPFRQQTPAASVDKVGRRQYTDRWSYRVFQSAPDLIRELLPDSAAAADALGLDPCAPGDRLYRFEATEIKELSNRLDGVLWPRESTGCAATGSPEFPVVLLEVLVITPHHRLRLGPSNPPRLLQADLEEVHWISLEEIRHTRAVQDWLAEGRQQGEAKGRQEGLLEGKAQKSSQKYLSANSTAAAAP